MTRELGRRLREARLAQGLTQHDVAEGIVTAAFLSMVESGRREPSAEVLGMLHARLGIVGEGSSGDAASRALAAARVRLVRAQVALGQGDFIAARAECDALSPVLTVEAEPDLRAQMLHRSGLANEGLGLLDAGIRDLADAVDLASSRGLAPLEVDATIDLVRCLRERGDVAAALDRAGTLLARFPDALHGTPVHGKLVSVVIGLHLARGDHATARLVADRAREAFGPDADVQARGFVLWNASLATEAAGDVRGALLLAQEAATLLSAGAQSGLLGRLHMAMAWMHTRALPPDLDEAAAEYDAAEACFGPNRSAVDAGLLHSERARLLCLRGDYAAAQDEVAIALDLFAALPVGVMGTGVHLVAARIHAGLGDLEASRAQVREAQRLLANTEPSRSTSIDWRELGDAYLGLGFNDDALLAYRQALSDAGLVETPVDAMPGADALHRLD